MEDLHELWKPSMLELEDPRSFDYLRASLPDSYNRLKE
jgi:hypothetical protein